MYRITWISNRDNIQTHVPKQTASIVIALHQLSITRKAVKMVRGEMGLKNVEIMIPFVRTLDMAKDVNEVLVPWTPL